ncbi:MAG: hypothetical protein RIM84_10755 [Alphaproteobacteria bacterium]
MHQAVGPEQDTQRNDGSVVILISLYLLLLAFFIMLTALSQRELTRAEAAVGSVTKVFNPDIAKQTLDKSTDSPAGLFRARDAYLSSVRATFADTLPVADFENLADGNLLRAEVPVENLFRPGTTDLFASSQSLLGGLGAALNRQEPELRLRLEVLLRSGPVLPTGDQLGQVLEVRRVAAISEALRGQGAPARLISVGVGPGDPGQVRFSFHAEPVPEPQPELVPADG